MLSVGGLHIYITIYKKELKEDYYVVTIKYLFWNWYDYQDAIVELKKWKHVRQIWIDELCGVVKSLVFF